MKLRPNSFSYQLNYQKCMFTQSLELESAAKYTIPLESAQPL